ncbi:MAG: Crp/Fnr family transcriptional regulator [Thermodesulfobacteriota bacterium]
MNQLHLNKMRRELSRYCFIPDEEWNEVAMVARLLRLKKCQHFTKIGDIPDKLGFISSGILGVFCVTEQGDERILAFRGENQLVAALGPYLEAQPSWYGIRALMESVLLCIDFKDLYRLMSDHSSWNTLVRRYLEDLFVQKDKRVREFLLEDATARYMSFKRNNPGLEAKIPQYHIASYLGITPVALSRIRKNLKKAPAS